MTPPQGKQSEHMNKKKPPILDVRHTMIPLQAISPYPIRAQLPSLTIVLVLKGGRFPFSHFFVPVALGCLPHNPILTKLWLLRCCPWKIAGAAVHGGH